MPQLPSSGSDALPAPSRLAGFPRSARLCAKVDFDRVFKDGKRSSEPALTLYWLQDPAPARLGLAVSRRVDPRAVGRNRIKRALREGFRSMRQGLRGGAYVVVARAEAARIDGPGLRAALARRLLKLGALPAVAGLSTMPPAADPADPAHASPRTPS